MISWKWAADPAGQGRTQRVSFDQIRCQRACLDEAFHAVTRQSGDSQRIQPLTVEEVARVNGLIGPRRVANGNLICLFSSPP